ncbi:MAG: HEPN domain-containing protein [Candidatus Helarchaeota archaeon]
MTSELLKDFAIKLVKEAESDLKSAEMQLRESRFHKAVFDSQQCVEKIMKSALALEGLTQIYDHDPTSLFISEIITRVNNDTINELREMIKETDWLMEQYSFTRYVRLRSRRVISPLEFYKKRDAEQAIQIAKNAMTTIKKLLKKFYNLDIS